MIELIVLYRMPNDPEHFAKYYREVHGPLTGKLPGVQGYKYGRVCALDGGTGEFFWYWSGTFGSRQAALDAMASPEGLAALPTCQTIIMMIRFSCSSKSRRCCLDERTATECDAEASDALLIAARALAMTA